MKRTTRDEKSSADALVLLSRGGTVESNGTPATEATTRVFECKVCDRRFSSFQALGGHRASHKKPRLSPEDRRRPRRETTSSPHECPVCGVEFSVGQALGGHMRRHRDAATAAAVEPDQEEKKKISKARGVLRLDLNSRAPMEESVDREWLKIGSGVEPTNHVDCFSLLDCFH